MMNTGQSTGMIAAAILAVIFAVYSATFFWPEGTTETSTSSEMFRCLDEGGHWNDNINRCEEKRESKTNAFEKDTVSQNIPQEKQQRPADTQQAEKPQKQKDWWKPEPRLLWQYQLDDDIDTSVEADVFDIDLFDAPQSVIDEIHVKGSKVICYFSAGTHEKWRTDAGSFPRDILGSEIEDNEDEKWIDIRTIEKIQDVMEGRLDLAKQKKCDGVEPDNVDAYQHKTGFEITGYDQLEYNKWLANQAHERGLSIGLKNDLDQVADLLDYYDFAVNEQCFEYDECDSLDAFVDRQKAVFGVEYNGNSKKFCKQASSRAFSWIKKHEDLDAWLTSC